MCAWETARNLSWPMFMLSWGQRSRVGIASKGPVIENFKFRGVKIDSKSSWLPYLNIHPFTTIHL